MLDQDRHWLERTHGLDAAGDHLVATRRQRHARHEKPRREAGGRVDRLGLAAHRRKQSLLRPEVARGRAQRLRDRPIRPDHPRQAAARLDRTGLLRRRIAVAVRGHLHQPLEAAGAQRRDRDQRGDGRDGLSGRLLHPRRHDERRAEPDHPFAVQRDDDRHDGGRRLCRAGDRAGHQSNRPGYQDGEDQRAHHRDPRVGEEPSRRLPENLRHPAQRPEGADFAEGRADARTGFRCRPSASRRRRRSAIISHCGWRKRASYRRRTRLPACPSTSAASRPASIP